MGAVVPHNFGITGSETRAPGRDVAHIRRPRLFANMEVVCCNLNIDERKTAEREKVTACGIEVFRENSVGLFLCTQMGPPHRCEVVQTGCQKSTRTRPAASTSRNHPNISGDRKSYPRLISLTGPTSPPSRTKHSDVSP